MDLIERYTEQKFIRFTSYAVIIFCLILLFLFFLTPDDRPSIFGTDKGYDFSILYIAGKILNNYGSEELYNFKLQNNLYHELRPYLPENISLPNPYPPFFNSIFMPLALLPFSYSYCVWLTISAFLYILGITLILKKTPNFNVRDKHTIFLLAISFEPFIMECWIGGQTSSFGFFFIAFAIYLYKSEKLFFSGISFGLCMYKPPLLLLIIPFFILTKQYRICLGILLTSAIVVIYTILFFGLNSLIDWLNFSIQHLNDNIEKPEILRITKFVDIVSFVRQIFGTLEIIERILIISIFVCWIVYIIFYLKILKIIDDDRKELALALIIIWSTVINIYFPIYDTIILVLLLIIIVDKQNPEISKNNIRLDKVTKLILICTYIVPWITFIFVIKFKIQFYTLVLIANGIFAGRLLQKRIKTVSINNFKKL